MRAWLRVPTSPFGGMEEVDVRHWWHKIRRGGQHRQFCTCQVIAIIWIGRGPVQPGMPMSPDEVEVITNG